MSTGETERARAPWYKRLFKKGPVVPVVRLQGQISQDQRPGRLNIASISPLLEKAFANRKAPAVALVVNSPGGSPVQSRLIARRIRQLADRHDKTVLVFVEDAAASGGYFIAVAGDEVIADPSSIVGSIGVVMAGFGFVDAIAKLGVTRRLYTAGTNKSTLDPFLPEKPEDVDHIKQLELDVHDVFIDYVRTRRGEKLKGEEAELFSGRFWTAGRALEMGLVDGLGEMHTVLRERYGNDVRLRPIAPKRSFFSLPGLGIGAQGTDDALGSALNRLEERALWARLGL
ncbi:S49 family peptidase [Pelagibacterium montanilacus]|uniref:S49 family peptidase n=1 Tax=Pelagibacterium montanilacus TaxID=2185280 RepID=UPI000F8C4ECD|nr:S49 family peptidase [Pelagibacterium montanilacus]